MANEVPKQQMELSELIRLSNELSIEEFLNLMRKQAMQNKVATKPQAMQDEETKPQAKKNEVVKLQILQNEEKKPQVKQIEVKKPQAKQNEEKPQVKQIEVKKPQAKQNEVKKPQTQQTKTLLHLNRCPIIKAIRRFQGTSGCTIVQIKRYLQSEKKLVGSPGIIKVFLKTALDSGEVSRFEGGKYKLNETGRRRSSDDCPQSRRRRRSGSRSKSSKPSDSKKRKLTESRGDDE